MNKTKTGSQARLREVFSICASDWTFEKLRLVVLAIARKQPALFLDAYHAVVAPDEDKKFSILITESTSKKACDDLLNASAADPDPISRPGPSPKPRPKPDLEPQLEPEPQPEPDPIAKTAVKPKPNSKSKAKPKPSTAQPGPAIEAQPQQTTIIQIDAYNPEKGYLLKRTICANTSFSDIAVEAMLKKPFPIEVESFVMPIHADKLRKALLRVSGTVVSTKFV